MGIAITAPAKAITKGNTLLSDGMGNHERVTVVDKTSTPGRVIIHTSTPAANHVYSLLPDTMVVVLKLK